jgi:hypothetical protein
MANNTIHNNECFDDEYNQINSFVLQSMSTRSPTPTGTWFPPTSVFTCTSGGPSTYTPTATPTSIAREPVITMVNSIIWDDSLASSRERITSYVIPFSGPNIRLSDEHFHISYSDVKDGLQVGPPPTPYQGDATNLYNIPYFVSDCSSYDNYFLSDGEHYHSVCIDSGRDPVTTPAFYIEPLARPDPSWNATTTPTSAFIHPTPVYMSDYTTNSEHTPDLDTVDMGFHHPIRGCPPYIPAIGIFCILTLVLIVGGIIYYLERHHNLG